MTKLWPDIKAPIKKIIVEHEWFQVSDFKFQKTALKPETRNLKPFLLP
jgi:hypothetical protein